MTDRPDRAATLFRLVRGGKRTVSRQIIQVQTSYGCKEHSGPLHRLLAW